MKLIIESLLTFIGKLICQLLKFGFFFSIYNFCYERVPYRVVKLLVKFVSLPDINANWKVVLVNKKIIISPILKRDPKTSQFALSYKWHSPALNFTEKILNDYYQKSIPWIDVGANLGIRSLLSLSYGRPVYFIEPNNDLNKINIDRCTLNGFKNYTVFEVGASNIKGEIEFYIDKSTYNSSIESKIFDKNSLDRKEIINTDTLDNLFKNQYNTWECACIKIDVEGHELKVIDGAKELISNLSPTMIIEVNTKGDHFLVFLNTMFMHGYSVYEIGKFGHKKFYKKIESVEDMLKLNLKFNDFLTIKDRRLETEIKKYTMQAIN